MTSTLASSTSTSTQTTHTKSIHHFYNFAVQFNNVGADFIDLKRHDHAKQALVHAINAMKMFVRPKDEGMANENDDEQLLSMAQTQLQHFQQRLNDLRKDQKNGRNGSVGKNEVVYESMVLPYERPVRINAPNQKKQVEFLLHSNSNSNECFEETAATLYNMALAYQLDCGRQHHKSHLDMQRIIEFYLLASRTLQSVSNQVISTISIDISYEMLCMAIFNNVGQIHHSAGDIVTARAHFDVVVKFHAMLATQDDGSHTLDLFLVNSLLLDLCPIASAAA